MSTMKIILLISFLSLPELILGRSRYEYDEQKVNSQDNGIYFESYQQPFGNKKDVKDPFARDRERLYKKSGEVISNKYDADKRANYGYNSREVRRYKNSDESARDYESNFYDTYFQTYSQELDSYSSEEFSGFDSDDEDYYSSSSEEKEETLSAIADNEIRIEQLEKQLDYKNSEIYNMRQKLLKVEHKMSKLEKMVKYQQKLHKKNSVLSNYYHKK